MKVLGVTGGIGCGKSTVIKLIKEQYRTYVISTDEVAQSLMKKGGECYRRIVEYFGTEILGEEEEIDRGKLGKRVFKSERELLKLNSFTHPVVREYVLGQIDTVKTQQADEYDWILVETALPYEARLKEYCDEILYVTASLEIRRERLSRDRGYSIEKINDIFNKQLSDTAYKEFSTHILVNDGSLEDISQQMKDILG